MAEIGYPDLVDIHGPLRNQGLAAFRLIPELAGLDDATLLSKAWPVWQLLVADLLDARDCPNCEGKGELGTLPNEILCPTCDSDGWTYGRAMSDAVHPEKNLALPPPPDTSDPRDRPSRPADVDAGSVGERPGARQ